MNTMMLKYFLIIIVCTIIIHLCFCEALEANATVQTRLNLSLTEMPDLSDEEPEETWLENALRDIAYDLRSHKFNEWDRRYYLTKPEDSFIGFYDLFPTPSLKSIHWEVHKYCRKDFFRCITYLHKILKTAPFTRTDDLVTNINKNSITINFTSLTTQNDDCKRAILHAEKTGLPFGAPEEKFMWRTSASYYMCWYTMQEHPALSMLGEPCDNFAYCLDANYGNKHHDPRSNDMLPFACAMYSFCPDPCCSLKHVHSLNECFNSGIDPCYSESDIIKSQCNFHRKYNQNLEEIVNNKWNVSCNCHQKGFMWDSKFGMCIDINECNTNLHNCDLESEDCLNKLGSYQCVCKWGYTFDNDIKKCIPNQVDSIQQFQQFKSRNNYNFDMRGKLEPLMNLF